MVDLGQTACPSLLGPSSTSPSGPGGAVHLERSPQRSPHPWLLLLLPSAASASLPTAFRSPDLRPLFLHLLDSPSVDLRSGPRGVDPPALSGEIRSATPSPASSRSGTRSGRCTCGAGPQAFHRCGGVAAARDGGEELRVRRSGGEAEARWCGGGGEGNGSGSMTRHFSIKILVLYRER